MENKLINRQEAANILGVNPQTISNMIKRGILPSVGYKSIKLVYSKDLYNLLNEMTSLVDIEKSLEELQNFENEIKKEKSRITEEYNDYRIESYKDRTTVSRLFREEIQLILRNVISETELSKRDQDVILAYIDGWTLKDISEKFKITKERIRQVINLTIKALQENKLSYHPGKIEKLEKENEELRDEIEYLNTKINCENELKYFSKNLYNIKIDIFSFPPMISRIIKDNNITTVGEVVEFIENNDLSKFRYMNKTTIKKFYKILQEIGINIKD